MSLECNSVFPTIAIRLEAALWLCPKKQMSNPPWPSNWGSHPVGGAVVVVVVLS